MSRCFSLTASRDWCYRSVFTKSGLKSTITDLNDGTVIHCWIPKAQAPAKPNLLLIHGFGANAMWQWCSYIKLLLPHYNLYIPDLVFFGDSYTSLPDRTESFQARCLMRVMEANLVSKMSIVGLSYGGFVAYSMAAQFEERVERVVICCAGVCVEERDLKEGLFKVRDVEEAARILVPQTPETMKELLGFAFVKLPKVLPSCLLDDFISVMCTEFVEEKRDLIRAIPRNRKLADIPKITQPTLIVWGEQDQIFPLELGYRHLGDNAELVVLKNTGHAFIVEKVKEFFKQLKSFLIDPPHPPVPVSSDGYPKHNSHK
ncbi:Alpha/beta hydrolase fold-1 [Dillenia turbinata]|uniref:Alpha/beta hydrolase fold-1 n=1 Tax=Dillenia turbinata TaxID=194707 RepID=A0AAN8VTW3_9MAGN